MVKPQLLTTENLVVKLFNRWRKRIFTNDDIVYRPSSEGEDFWDIVLTRENREFRLTISPQAIYKSGFMLDADNEMRHMLRKYA